MHVGTLARLHVRTLKKAQGSNVLTFQRSNVLTSNYGPRSDVRLPTIIGDSRWTVNPALLTPTPVSFPIPDSRLKAPDSFLTPDSRLKTPDSFPTPDSVSTPDSRRRTRDSIGANRISVSRPPQPGSIHSGTMTGWSIPSQIHSKWACCCSVPCSVQSATCSVPVTRPRWSDPLSVHLR